MKENKTTIELTKDEALVLFEVLSRFSDTEVLAAKDQPEETALWNLCGALEKSLSEPFQANYKTLLEQAKKLRV